MTSEHSFEKYEGLGNDFVLLEAAGGSEGALEAPWAARARTLCDRHFGIGADGLLLVSPARSGDCDAHMHVVNADGSTPEMCGNGIRCVALHLARARGLRKGTLRIETDAGVRECSFERDLDAATVSVDMGLVRVIGERALDVSGETRRIVVADVGNPHAVLFGAFGNEEVARLGPRIATHSMFAHGTNVEFAAAASDGIDLVVWERGVGLTLGCGTGACATAAAACMRGLARHGVPIAVRLPGGTLDVTIDEDGRAVMRGPAKHVFSGVVGFGF
jgi:diaminopimelate epimerase